MGFVYICDLENSVCGERDVTIRTMFDIGTWGISYEPGPFWFENEESLSFCGELNEQWFYEDLHGFGGIDVAEFAVQGTLYSGNVIFDCLIPMVVIGIGGIVAMIWFLAQKYRMQKSGELELLCESDECIQRQQYGTA